MLLPSHAISLATPALLDVAGLAVTVTVIAQFTKQAVKLATGRFSTDTRTMLVRLYVYALSYLVVVYALWKSAQWHGWGTLSDALGPALSVWTVAIIVYHVATQLGGSDDSTVVPPVTPVPVAPAALPIAPPASEPVSPPAQTP